MDGVPSTAFAYRYVMNRQDDCGHHLKCCYRMAPAQTLLCAAVIGRHHSDCFTWKGWAWRWCAPSFLSVFVYKSRLRLRTSHPRYLVNFAAVACSPVICALELSAFPLCCTFVPVAFWTTADHQAAAFARSPITGLSWQRWPSSIYVKLLLIGNLHAWT